MLQRIHVSGSIRCCLEAILPGPVDWLLVVRVSPLFRDRYAFVAAALFTSPVASRLKVASACFDASSTCFSAATACCWPISVAHANNEP